MARFRPSTRGLVLLVGVLCLAGCPNSCAESLPGPGTAESDTPGIEAPGESGAGSGGAALEIIEIAAGEAHTVALTGNGAVWTCGNGGDGQLGWEQTEMCFSGRRVDGLPGIRDVAAGTGFSVFLAADGELWGAGYGFDERLGPTEAQRFTAAVQLGIGGLVDIAAYTNFTLGRRADDSVVAFGVNDAGALGHGSSADSPTPVETGVQAVAIDAGGGYALALTANGRVKSWGINNYGTLGNPAVPRQGTGGSATASAHGFFSLTPVEVQIDGVVAISAGTDHALAAREDGTVWGWGRNARGCLGQSEINSQYPTPIRIEGLADIVSVAAGSNFGLALTRDGRVLSWGEADLGRLGRRTSGAFATEPGFIEGLPPIADIVAGRDRGYAIDRSGRAWAWGSNEFGQLLADAEGLGPPVAVALGGDG